MISSYALQEITQNYINCEYVGDAIYVYGMNEIHVVEKEILFCRSS
jgi:hypothetical protein